MVVGSRGFASGWHSTPLTLFGLMSMVESKTPHPNPLPEDGERGPDSLSPSSGRGDQTPSPRLRGEGWGEGSSDTLLSQSGRSIPGLFLTRLLAEIQSGGILRAPRGV